MTTFYLISFVRILPVAASIMHNSKLRVRCLSQPTLQRRLYKRDTQQAQQATHSFLPRDNLARLPPHLR